MRKLDADPGAFFLFKAIPGAFVSSLARFSQTDGQGVVWRAFLDFVQFWRINHDQFSFFTEVS
jgi:hypothetical protein